jgi:hypothetical protein
MRNTAFIVLANEKPAEMETIALANGFTVLQKDVLRVPYGETPNARTEHGKVIRYVQVFDRAAAQQIADNLENDVPIFIGHPDHPDFAESYTDRKAYGWVTGATVGDKEILFSCKWSKAGEELLANAHFKFASPNWGCVALPSKTSVKLVRPVELYSIGLTNMPNIKAMSALVNEAKQNTKEGTNMKDILLKLLGLAAEATEDQLVGAVEKLANERKTSMELVAGLQGEKTGLETALANEKKARTEDKAAHDSALATAIADSEAQKSAFANERKARIELLANQALDNGKITVAQKPQTIADLEKDLDGTVTRLANARAVLPTDAKTKELGARKSEGMSTQDKVLAFVNERMNKGEDYMTAFANVKKDHKELFQGMKNPATK